MSEKIHEKRELSKNTNKTVIFKKQNKKNKKTVSTVPQL